MKVKIGNKIYSDEIEPIMVILSDSDKLMINNMSEANYKYACFPNEEMTAEEKLEWMNS